MKNIIFLGIIFMFVSGCSTNKIVYPEKIKMAYSLTAKSESLEEAILTEREMKNREINELQRKLNDLKNNLEQELGEKNMYLERTKHGLKLTILDKILFASGSAVISNQGEKILIKVADILENTNQPIQITGHTDNEPINRTKYLYASNWDLSIKRALNVIHIFKENNVPAKKMFAVGYGEYEPIDTNETKKGRSHNRRVEIILGVDLEKTNDADSFYDKKETSSTISTIK